MEQLPRLPKKLFTLRAAELVRSDSPHETMAGRTWVVLLEELTAGRQGGQLLPQPTERSPDRAVVEQPSRIQSWGAKRCLVGSRAASGAGRFTIGLPVVLQVESSQREQRRTGVTLIGQYESRGNR